MQTDPIEVHRTARQFALFVYTLAATALLASLLVACGGGGGGGDAGNAATTTPLKRIVYQRSVATPDGGFQADLYAVNEDGSENVALAVSPNDESLAMDWTGAIARAGDRVIYNMTDPGETPDLSIGTSGVYSVKTDGTGSVALAASGKHERVVAVVGDHVIITADGGEILSVRADGSGLVSIAANAWFVGVQQGRVLFDAELGAGSLRLYSALPDGGGVVELVASPGSALAARDPLNRAQLVYMTIAGRLLLADNNGGLHITSPDATRAVQLAAAGVAYGLASWDPVHSAYRVLPVGERIAYIDTDGALFSVRSDGTGTLPLVQPPANGQLEISGAVAGHLLYRATGPAGTQSGLYAIDMAGGLPKLLGAGNNVLAADVTSGDRVIVAGASNPFDLASMSVDGGEGRLLANGVNVSFSGGGPDLSVHNRALATFGKRIVFRAANGAVLNTYSVNNDGTGLVTLVGGTDPSDPEALGLDRLYFRRVVNEQSDLYSILPDGTGLVTLANNAADERFGIFCGSKVVYTRLAGNGKRDLVIVNGDGSGTRVLSSNADDKWPVGVF